MGTSDGSPVVASRPWHKVGGGSGEIQTEPGGPSRLGTEGPGRLRQLQFSHQSTGDEGATKAGNSGDLQRPLEYSGEDQ